MNPVLIAAINQLPAVLALIRDSVPAGTPPPTEEELLAALKSAVESSIAKDEAWLAAHPL